jgi:hypothetical protein
VSVDVHISDGLAAFIVVGLPDVGGTRGNLRRRTFIAFSFGALAISTPVCFHSVSNASTEEVHMKIHSTNRQMPKLCAAAAADSRSLLG